MHWRTYFYDTAQLAYGRSDPEKVWSALFAKIREGGVWRAWPGTRPKRGPEPSATIRNGCGLKFTGTQRAKLAALDAEVRGLKAAHSVRGPKHAVKRGKTPVLTPDEPKRDDP